MCRTQRTVRRSILAGGALALVRSACSDSTTPPDGTVIPAAEASDIGAAEGEEVEQAVAALTTPASVGATAPTAPPTCATVTTVTPLVWDAACVSDRKISSGETRATLGNGSYIRTVWTACGVDPTRTFVPAPA